MGKSCPISVIDKHDPNAEILSVLLWMALLPQKLSGLVCVYLEAHVSPGRGEDMPVLFIPVSPAAHEASVGRMEGR